MVNRGVVRALLVAGALSASLGLFQPAAAGAATVSFNCDASALRVQLLNLPPLEPVTANRGASLCQAASGVLGQLPAPIDLKAATAQTLLTNNGQEADAVGGLLNLSVAPLNLPSSLLTSLQAVNNLAPITVPLGLGGGGGVSLPGLPSLGLPLGGSTSTGTTSTGTSTLGLPSSITIDIRPAVDALLAALPNANLIDLHVANAYARAFCSNGAPQLDGGSQVLGLSVLGQQLPTDQALTQALNLINTQSINLGNLDLSKIVLPAGLSFTDPVIGTVLQTAVHSVLAALPPISIPASVALVRITPNEQIRTANDLTQRALHVVVSLLGQNIADVVLGEAHVSDSSANCAPKQAASLALQCTTRKLTLIDVLQHGNHVDLLGAADKSLIGKRVDIYFYATGQKVASAIVGADQFFRTTAPLPPASVRETNLARYQARDAAGERSLNLKLRRRMIVNSLTSSHHQVTIKGQVVEPLADPVKAILIQRRVSCTQLVTVKRLMPGPGGKFSVTLPAPPNQQAAAYRATTEVRKYTTNPKLFPTFTLPRFVELR